MCEIDVKHKDEENEKKINLKTHANAIGNMKNTF